MTLIPTPQRDARDRKLQQLSDAIAELCTHIDVATHRLLQLIAEFDEAQGWFAHGFKTCAHWLSWRTNIDLGAAREKVRVARALPRLPKTNEALSRGEVSYSKVRAMTRIATAENETTLLTMAKAGTAAQVEKIVRYTRQANVDEENARAMHTHEARSVTTYTDEHGMVHLTAKLPPELGARVVAVLQEADRLLRCEDNAAPEQTTAGQRRADALVLVADAAAGSGLAQLCADDDDGKRRPAAERTQVVIHVDAEVLADPSQPGCSEVAGGVGALSAETSRRLSCDASTVLSIDDKDGTPLSLGRKTRRISTALRRALARRDDGCCFPGCTHRRFLESHHVVHWAEGGETNMENIRNLCSFHHRLIHEGGFAMRLDENGEPVFYTPRGDRVHAAPPPPVVHDSVGTLQRQHRALGLDIDAHTAGAWDGIAVDYHTAVDCLLQWPEVGDSEHQSSGSP